MMSETRTSKTGAGRHCVPVRSWLRSASESSPLEPIGRDFENAGTSRPVKIPQELKPALVQVLEMWGQNMPGGLRALPAGPLELRDKVAEEIFG
jgi:hypothetical protein